MDLRRGGVALLVLPQNLWVKLPTKQFKFPSVNRVDEGGGCRFCTGREPSAPK